MQPTFVDNERCVGCIPDQLIAVSWESFKSVRNIEAPLIPLPLEGSNRAAVPFRMAVLDLIYYQNPGVNMGDPFRLWTIH